MNIVIDTNIFFSIMLKKEGFLRNRLLLDLDLNTKFYTCHFLMIEIFKYKEKIVKQSKMTEEEILEVLYILLKKIELYNETYISDENYKKAYDLCKNVDVKDIPFVALTLELDGKLWTGDKKLKKSLIEQGMDIFY